MPPLKQLNLCPELTKKEMEAVDDLIPVRRDSRRVQATHGTLTISHLLCINALTPAPGRQCNLSLTALLH